MIKVLFICHGNICRSPMAEFVMKDLVKKAHLEDRFEIASAATSTEEIWGGRGNPVYPPARAKLKEHGIDPGGKRARRTTRDDYKYYDYLIGMDYANVFNMKRIYGGDPDGKISLLLDYCGRNGQEVADPWYPIGEIGCRNQAPPRQYHFAAASRRHGSITSLPHPGAAADIHELQRESRGQGSARGSFYLRKYRGYR